MEEDIKQYLLDKYNPKVIILHGSRALGMARDNSDWDLYIFVDSKISGGTEEYKNQHLDISLIHLPLEKYDFIDYFGTTLNNAKILYDTDSIGKDLIAEAQAIYGKGRNLSSRDLLNRKNRGKRLLERIKGTQNNPELQFYHLGAFYESIIRYWFEIKNEWHLPPYKALPIIAEKDPNFYKHLLIISGNYEGKEKAQSAEYIYHILFPKA